MSGLIGKKIGMTSIFDENGKNIPCTVIQAGPCVVTQIRSKEVDGYDAIQLAYDDAKPKHINKPLKGPFAKAGAAPKRITREFTRFEEGHQKKFGDILLVDVFEEGEYIDVIGTSKGKGFQGVVNRHNFGGVGDTTHGQHNRLRAPGSIGASSYPSRVFKGMRMAGQMGNAQVKVRRLQILKVFPEQNIILVKGAVPGANGSYVIIERWS